MDRNLDDRARRGDRHTIPQAPGTGDRLASIAVRIATAGFVFAIGMAVVGQLSATQMRSTMPSSSHAAIAQPEAIDGFRTFVAPDGAFQIRMPDAWMATAGPDPSVLYLVHGALGLTVRGPDAEGELSSSIGLGDGRVLEGPIRSATTLGGEPATHWIVGADGGESAAVQYVVTLHDGRPFIVRAVGPLGVDDIAALLDGFEFRLLEQQAP
jgi:hypothetical protein